MQYFPLLVQIAQRAWVSDNWIIPHLGKADFEAKREEVRASCAKRKGSNKNKPLKPFVATGLRNKKQWEDSIEGQ